MRAARWYCSAWLAVTLSGVAFAQPATPNRRPPGNTNAQPVRPPGNTNNQPPKPTVLSGPQPVQTAPGQTNPQASTPAAAQPPAPTGPPTTYGGISFNNASLTEVIDMLARQLKLNYILDPRVKGGVILNTYGETKNIDPKSLLEAILRINGAGMVKEGELYRILPLADISHHALTPEKVDRSGGHPGRRSGDDGFDFSEICDFR